MIEIHFTAKQRQFFLLVGMIFVITLILGILSNIFFPIDPLTVVNSTELPINLDLLKSHLYGIQIGIFIFSIIGITFYCVLALLKSMKKLKISIISMDDNNYNKNWPMSWIGALLFLFGVSIAFIPIDYTPLDILIFPTLVTGTFLGAIGALISKTGIISKINS